MKRECHRNYRSHLISYKKAILADLVVYPPGISAIVEQLLLIIREREKAQKKIQDYLEKELEARTRVVMKQKGEIELQNWR